MSIYTNKRATKQAYNRIIQFVDDLYINHGFSRYELIDALKQIVKEKED